MGAGIGAATGGIGGGAGGAASSAAGTGVKAGLKQAAISAARNPNTYLNAASTIAGGGPTMGGGDTIASNLSPSGLDDPNTFVGPRQDGRPAQADSRIPWGTILKYGAPVGAAAIQGVQQNKALNTQRDMNTERLGLEESTLDPFRGYTAQSKDLGRLDFMLNQGGTQNPYWHLSDDSRSVLTQARDAIAAGRTAPTMTNPKNAGMLPVVAGGARAPQTDPQLALLMARIAARRKASGPVTGKADWRV